MPYNNKKLKTPAYLHLWTFHHPSLCCTLKLVLTNWLCGAVCGPANEERMCSRLWCTWESVNQGSRLSGFFLLLLSCDFCQDEWPQEIGGWTPLHPGTIVVVTLSHCSPPVNTTHLAAYPSVIQGSLLGGGLRRRVWTLRVDTLSQWVQLNPGGAHHGCAWSVWHEGVSYGTGCRTGNVNPMQSWTDNRSPPCPVGTGVTVLDELVLMPTFSPIG